MNRVKNKFVMFLVGFAILVIEVMLFTAGVIYIAF